MADSKITKKAIATCFKILCAAKSFDKISIADITDACGLNRQTFYYHFKDKYELVDFIYQTEAFSKLVDGITLDNWPRHIALLLDAMQAEQAFYINTVKCAPEHFSSYLFNVTHALFLEAIEALDNEKSLYHGLKDSYAAFYAYGCCGVVSAWVKTGMKTPAQQMAHQLEQLARDSEKIAYRRYCAEREKAEEQRAQLQIKSKQQLKGGAKQKPGR